MYVNEYIHLGFVLLGNCSRNKGIGLTGIEV